MMGWAGHPLLALLLLPFAARAQVADVVRPDAQGDFTSIRVAGARGFQAQRFWLVVDRDPRGLACRDERGRARIALRYGAVVRLDEPQVQQAPLLIGSKSYLRLMVQPTAILHDSRLRERGQPAVCIARANSVFLAPIQMDTLEREAAWP